MGKIFHPVVIAIIIGALALTFLSQSLPSAINEAGKQWRNEMSEEEDIGKLEGVSKGFTLMPHLNVGEHLIIGKFKYEIVESGQVCKRSFEPLAELRRVE